MKRQNVRTLSLVVCTFTYLLIGAAVFDALESDTEAKRLITLGDITHSIKRKYNITDGDYLLIETSIIENKPHKAGPQWKFAGAFYFATVVLAMIGYGHSTPATIGGKAFCMMYAMIGIPLGLVMFQSIGERLNKVASVVIRQLKTCLRFQKTEATEMNLMMATGFLSSVITFTGAAVFSQYEGWTYFDSFYYCFVTLTTIGFGDYVALQNDQALSKKPGYVALSLVFILFGLAVVAASINLLVLRFMTMQAEDIKRDEAERDEKLAMNEMVNLEGEIMSTVNGKLLGSYTTTNAGDNISDQDQASVCSCTCYGYSHSGYGPRGWGSKKSNRSSSSTSSRRSYTSNSSKRRKRLCQLLPLDRLTGTSSSAVAVAAAVTAAAAASASTPPPLTPRPRSRHTSDVYDNFFDDPHFLVAKRASV